MSQSSYRDSLDAQVEWLRENYGCYTKHWYYSNPGRTEMIFQREFKKASRERQKILHQRQQERIHAFNEALFPIFEALTGHPVDISNPSDRKIVRELVETGEIKGI